MSVTNTKAATIPTITNSSQLEQMMQVWKNSLTRTLAIAAVPPPPLNFTATNARGGIQLAWSPTRSTLLNSTTLGQGTAASGPDGYTIAVSRNGSFTDDLEIYTVQDFTQTRFFYPTPSGPTVASFRIHSTSGTASNPQSRSGPDSGTVRHVSIDSSDTSTKPVTVRDTYTSDVSRSTARVGRYAHQYLNYTYLSPNGGKNQ